jgi:hypothetical protein
MGRVARGAQQPIEYRAFELRSAVRCSRLASTAAAVTYDRNDHNAAAGCHEALLGALECRKEVPRETLSLHKRLRCWPIYTGGPVVVIRCLTTCVLH